MSESEPSAELEDALPPLPVVPPAAPPFPSTGVLLGVDWGLARIGLAICDADRRVASPLSTYVRRQESQDAAALKELARQERAVGWVVGLAISLNDTEGAKAKECRAFGAWLTTQTGLPVTFQDERFTSSIADDAMRSARLSPAERKARRDRIAASLILQAYLDYQRSKR
jgi:putative Holliday junction resolvase